MKPKPNWSEIENRIDFGSVSQKLTQFATSGGGRKRTVADLLDKVKDALIQARSQGASYRALAAFLNESGLPVSEPTLRQYLNANGASKKSRGKKPGANRSAPNTQPSRETPAPKPETPAQPLPASPVAPLKPEPQPACDPWAPRTRGPRIADVNNL